MKLIIILISIFSLKAAQASYYATHCSNAQGTVKWESGHNSNTLTIKSLEGSISIKLNDVKIDVQNKISIYSHELACPGPMASKTDIYSAKALITPSSDAPNIFEGKVENDKLEVYVICEFHMNGRRSCPPTENF